MTGQYDGFHRSDNGCADFFHGFVKQISVTAVLLCLMICE
jgi:hypothetical protein